MSNRRKPRPPKQPRQEQCSPDPAKRPLLGMEPWVRAMQEADAAERRGDAAGALAAMRRRDLGPDGRPFWRAGRVVGLRQLVLLERFVPGWVRSRWILAQALQHLSERDRGPRSRVLRAHAIVNDLHARSGSTGRSPSVEHQAQVADHDWVYRQVHLFELGGLEAFLENDADPDLVAGADRIGEWALAPMGGYLFVEADAGVIRWLDLVARAVVQTPDIGSAAHLTSGASVIGRLVPYEGGVLFESPPLAVPRSLAAKVGHDPARWLDLLRESGLVQEGKVSTRIRAECGLLSDVPFDEITAVLSSLVEPRGRVSPADGDLARATLLLMHDVLAQLEHPCGRGGGDCCPGCPGAWNDGSDDVAYLHAALVHPAVVEALPDLLGPHHADLLSELRDVLAEPARSWVDWLLGSLEEAA